MGKFATDARPHVKAPVTTTGRMSTFEHGHGYSRDAKSDLFLLAVTNMVREDTFYEQAATRDTRYVELIHQVTKEDPEWVAAFVPWLRDVAQMRSASLVMAAEYLKAGGPNARHVIDAALKRADEPAEMLGYWFQTHGRHIPASLKRGVADAVTRLYTERAALRYDGTARVWRFGDVIDLVHPHPRAGWQSDLFRWLLDSRHGRTDRLAETMEMTRADRWLLSRPEDARREVMASRQGTEMLQRAGWSWERLAGWIPGGMDAAAWEAAIPNMGYMALLRNLRNFDEAGVSHQVASKVAAKLADPDEVARSRQFPFRFLSAFREIASLRWAPALEEALDLSLRNVPILSGRTLVLVDWSGSMFPGSGGAYQGGGGVSGRSKRHRYEIATLFGAALAKRAEHADTFAFGSSTERINTRIPLLKVIDQAHGLGGTYALQAIGQTWDNHDRIVIVTDEQYHDAGRSPLPPGSPGDPLVYTWNVAGYAPAGMPSGENGRYSFGGLTDAAFKMIPLIEAQRDGRWPHLEPSGA